MHFAICKTPGQPPDLSFWEPYPDGIFATLMPSNEQPRLDFATGLDFSQILTNPILDIAARVWADDRYAAFRTCYRSMRRIDDLVDHRKAGGHPLSPTEAHQFERVVIGWLESMQRHEAGDQFQKEFLTTLDQFAIPLWPWERLCSAMVYDLSHNGYSTFHQFLRYTEGAAVAPAAVFMHLCAIRQTDQGVLPPPFDIHLASRHLAVFSYLVHILRDWQKDHREQLNYFSSDILDTCGITVPEIRKLAEEDSVTYEFRLLLGRYVEITEFYRRKARAMLDRIMPQLEPRYQLSLELIYQLYLQIFERVDPEGMSVSGAVFGPPPDAVQLRINQTIARFIPVPPAAGRN